MVVDRFSTRVIIKYPKYRPCMNTARAQKIDRAMKSDCFVEAVDCSSSLAIVPVVEAAAIKKYAPVK